MAKKTTTPTTEDTQKPATSPHVAPNSQIEVTLPWETVEPVYQKYIAQVAQKVKLPGFRPGKVPPALAEKQVDRGEIIDRVLQDLLPEAYTAELKKVNKVPISQPDIEPITIEKGQDWKLVLYFAEKPEVKLGDYKKTVATAVKAAQKDIADQEKELAVKAKEAEKAKKDDKTDEKAEETAKAPTALTDSQKDDVKLRHIFKNLAESVAPAIPEILIAQETNQNLRRLVEQLQQFQLPVEKYLESRQMSADDLRQEYMQTALGSLQIEFILAEIARSEKITVEDKEIEDTVAKMNQEHGHDHPVSDEYRSYLFSTLLKQKVVKHLLSLS